jgi:hypothetical protein
MKQTKEGQGVDWFLFYGTRCQLKIPVPNTSAVRTFGAGTERVIDVSAQIVVAQSYTLARRNTPNAIRIS